MKYLHREKIFLRVCEGVRPIQKQSELESFCLNTNLSDNIQWIKQTLGNSPDIVVRELSFGGQTKVKAAVIYTSALADVKFITQFIMEPLMLYRDEPAIEQFSPDEDSIMRIKNVLLPVGEVQDTMKFDMLLSGILSGNTALLCDGHDHGLLIASKGWEDRAIQEPTSQTVIRGPKEGFTENIATNISLVRRKIKEPNLWLENFHIGQLTKTDVSIMY